MNLYYVLYLDNQLDKLDSLLVISYVKSFTFKYIKMNHTI